MKEDCFASHLKIITMTLQKSAPPFSFIKRINNVNVAEACNTPKSLFMPKFVEKFGLKISAICITNVIFIQILRGDKLIDWIFAEK